MESERSNLLSILAANKEEQLKRAKAESMAHEAQLKMLRYQLNPHFLFNTLNSISSLVNKRDDSRANEMILQLSDFLRHSLYIDPVEGITLKEELDALHLYLRIEQARFGDRLSVHLDVSSDAEQLNVPSMILQPLVENAIKYAIAPCEEGGEIKISAGLYKDEKRAFLPFSIASPLLFLLGAAFSFYIVMPLAFDFFLGFQQKNEDLSDLVGITYLGTINEYLGLTM